MASPALSHSQIDEIIRQENVEEWLELWLESQGGSTRNRRLELMAASIPFPGNEEIAVLDVCCGPGDVGRFIRRRFGVARVDLVDRDPFLLALGRELNRRAGIPGQTFVRDLWEPGWLEGLGAGYHVIGAATALHWFDVARLGELFADFFRLLRPRGVLVFTEPVGAAPPFATGFEEWRASEPSTYDLRTWDRFWSRANTLLGYDHREVLENRPRGRNVIGDAGIPVLEYVDLLKCAGFKTIDILLRDPDKATVVAVKGTG